MREVDLFLFRQRNTVEGEFFVEQGKMHITAEEMSTEKRKPERDKKIFLNIPIDGKSEILSKPKGNKSTLLNSKYESELESSLQKLCLSDDKGSDDESSGDEEERKLLESTLIAKCPDKVKDAKKEQQRAQVHPYNQITHVSSSLQSGGGVSVPHLIYSPILSSSQIPQPVKDFELEEEISQNQINNMMKFLSEEEMKLLFNAVDELKVEQEKEVKSAQRIRDTCNNSPDSSYGTMSPASVPPSPFSMHSPNARYEKRLSESDSLGEYDLGATELSIGNFELRLGAKLTSISASHGGGNPNGYMFIPPPPKPTITQSVTVSQSLQPPRQVYLSPPQQVPVMHRQILPESIAVNEVGLEQQAVSRMREKKLLKDPIVEVKWISLIQEVTPILKIGKNSSPEYQRKKDDLKKKLFDLVSQGPTKQKHFYEELYCRVQLYKKHFMDILVGQDSNGESLLFVAAMHRNDTPLVARLLADIMAKEPKKPYLEALDGEGNSILHYLACKGDLYAQTLSELLHSKAFDINHKNAGSKTAIHKAVETHANESSLASVKQFIKHGAVLTVQDLHGRTPLHLAVTYPQCDPQLLRALLMSNSANEAVNITDTEQNTPLHIAAKRDDLSLEKQKEFIHLLMMSKARHELRNRDLKVALSLVKPERLEEIKMIIHRKI